jgi:hypothetical protein
MLIKLVICFTVLLKLKKDVVRGGVTFLRAKHISSPFLLGYFWLQLHDLLKLLMRQSVSLLFKMQIR